VARETGSGLRSSSSRSRLTVLRNPAIPTCETENARNALSKEAPHLMRKVLVILAVFAAAALTATAAIASPANPSWQYANASLSANGQTISVNFKEVGLGSQYLSDTITLSATVEALWGCYTRGPTSNHPQASNKEGPGTLSNTQTFATKHGQITDTISLSIAAPNLCSPGQDERLISASYTNITIHGTAGDFLTSPSSFTYPS
jgi:hypothetical protein